MSNDEEIKHPSKALNLFKDPTSSIKISEKIKFEEDKQIIEPLEKDKKDLCFTDKSIHKKKISNLIDDDFFNRIPTSLKLSQDEKKLYLQDHQSNLNSSIRIGEQQVKLGKKSLIGTFMPFGDSLKQARISQNFSYQYVYNITKIHIKFLQNFEEEKFSNFPASTYVKAHLKKLCQLYKLPYDILLEQYELLTDKKIKSKMGRNTVLVKKKTIKKKQLINIDFFLSHYKLASIIAGIILLLVLFRVFSFDSSELMVIDLSIFIEEYELPEYKFIIPLGGY